MTSNLPSQGDIWLIGYLLQIMESNVICLLYSFQEWAFIY